MLAMWQKLVRLEEENAALRAENAALKAENAQLKTEVAHLKEQLRLNSSNTSKTWTPPTIEASRRSGPRSSIVK
jgi:cell division protein FtsB